MPLPGSTHTQDDNSNSTSPASRPQEEVPANERTSPYRSHPASSLPVRTGSLDIPKNRSFDNLSSRSGPSSSLRLDIAGQHRNSRLSIDSNATDYEHLSRSPILSDRDTGLRRIRQAPTKPSPNLASESFSVPGSAAPSRKSSLSAAVAQASPTLPFGDDLARFPSESLHSFSFAHQSAESLQSRQNVIKRSLEFMRDKLGWAATTPRIASAQARLNGDEELLNIMELLERANVIGLPGAPDVPGSSLGPLTGPAHLSNENIFDKSFDIVSESPEKLPSLTSANRNISPTALDTPTIALPEDHSESVLQETDEAVQRPDFRRSALKRTYTDTSGLSLQHHLSEVMAKPYSTSKPSSVQGTSIIPLVQPGRNTTVTERAPHGGHRNNPQAIFTTGAESPWTITAANDLACLVFGVTRAEVRKLGIMEVIKEERRNWLVEKLKNPDSGSSPRNVSKASHSQKPLLSKPPVRDTYKSKRRAKTDEGQSTGSPLSPSHHTSRQSRGVLLCGDVVPIKKRNGAYGSASLWVKEKSGGLIWVLEEIAEDVAYITVDGIGSIVKGSGHIEPIWGLDRVRSGMDVQKLVPSFPKLAGTYTGAIDYDAVAQLKRFTARTCNAISVPITMEQLPGESTFRVSSFPHIAGIIVVNPTSMRVSSSNSVFSAALFGHANPDGLHITELIPEFDKVLDVMTDEDKIALIDGIVIPEHSFRHARALLALRQGNEDASSIFLKPSGIPARHRDGAEIMIDVLMRVVKSDKEPIYNESVIIEESGNTDVEGTPESEVVYALWVTYSRQLHAANHGVGPIANLASRPTTPPTQPLPGNLIDEVVPSPMILGDGADDPRVSLLSQQLEDMKAIENESSIVEGSPEQNEPFEHPSPELIAAKVNIIKKKKIDDFIILEEMGQGAYGQVKLARYRKPAAKKMVIKYVTKRRILVDTWHRDRRLGTVPLEIHVLDYLRRDGLQHPNIVEMVDFFEDNINYYIEMKPHGLPGMDLFDYIELRVTMEEPECRKIFKQVAEALRHLHIVAKVVHRDIKDENIILDGEGKVKLVDFGSAAYIKSGPFDVFVGTIDYAAPEVLRGAPYRGKEQDVWALGILLYTIVYKENPFYSIDEIMDHDLRVPWVMSEACIDLIRKMLDRDVERRIGIQAVLEHEWCTTVDPGDEEEVSGDDRH
ncbi:hypothetical protein AMS68_001025 [Peltaster fructicola]|uniref:non-specific serine/threonine protein kinase n=1 Tax=Peltaster fructicola TaxID=286661 RepID=A0A6H0XLK3_9PEZI|nr:hypothetical protein AMS68_001025 [Peltaster fructicola]